MTQTQHTAGPWIAVDGILEPDDEGNARSFVRPAHSEGWQIAQTCGPNGSDNARLIAAAPELLEALVRIATANPDDVPQWELRDIAEAAIAKATGAS